MEEKKDENSKPDSDADLNSEGVASPSSGSVSDNPEDSMDASPVPSSSSSTPVASIHHLEDPHIAHAQHQPFSQSQSVSTFKFI